RALVDTIAAVHDADRLLLGGCVEGQVGLGHAATRLTEDLHYRSGYGSLVKGLLATLGHCAESLRQARVAEDFAGLRSAAVNSELNAVGSGGQPLGAALPV